MGVLIEKMQQLEAQDVAITSEVIVIGFRDYAHTYISIHTYMDCSMCICMYI